MPSADDATGHSPPNPLVSGLHFRGRLPHLKKEGAVYFVTFRLGDSLPAHEIARLKHERQVILEQARAAKSPLTWHEAQQLLAWYCDKVEALLDAGHGACWLSKPEVADLVAGAVRHFAGQRYELRSWVVMPNHVHVVVWPMPDYTLSEVLHSWNHSPANGPMRFCAGREHSGRRNLSTIGFATMTSTRGWWHTWKTIP